MKNYPGANSQYLDQQWDLRLEIQKKQASHVTINCRLMCSMLIQDYGSQWRPGHAINQVCPIYSSCVPEVIYFFLS